MAKFIAYVQESPRSKTIYVPFTVDDSALVGLRKHERNELIMARAVEALKSAPNVFGDWWEWLRSGYTEDES